MTARSDQSGSVVANRELPRAGLGPSICALCGLPAPATVLDPDYAPGLVFCCNGCKNVRRILAESGQLTAMADVRALPLFQHALSAGIIAGASAADTTLSDEIQVTPSGDGGSIEDVRRCILRIDGMWCASCAWLISETLKRRKGVLSAEVSFAGDSARVTYKPARIGFIDMRDAVRALGYDASEDDPADGKDSPGGKKRQAEMIRVTVAFIFCTMNVMMLTPILYLGPKEGVTPFETRMIDWLLLLLSIPVFVSAFPLFDRAVRAARHGAATMETLVTVGASSALVYSVWQVLHGALTSYFDTADMLLGLVLIGKYIENNIRARAADSIALLHGLTPKKATLLTPDGAECSVAVGEIAAQDLIRVRAGEIVAADGLVEHGGGSVNESLLTGEARPAAKGIGDPVTGGSTLEDGYLDVRITRPPGAGALHQMAEVVQDSLHRKTRSEQIADRISRVFVPTVIVMAIAAAGWVFEQHHDVGAAVTRAVAVLVIACPCALGIAIPMAILAGVAAAAHQGMVVSDPEALGVARRLKRVVFDKTGTLTEGRFRVLQCLPADADISDLSALESLSEHPIARAIRDYAHRSGVGIAASEAERIEDFGRMAGGGLHGTLRGVPIFAGNARLVAELGAALPDEFERAAAEWSAAGRTVVYFGRGASVCAVLGLGDRLRASAPGLVRGLRALGIASEIVSGDAEATVEAVARESGVDSWQGGVLPADKASLVAERMSNEAAGTVAMVGDGVNDAPALARADLGVAMENGADIAGRAAAITIMSSHIDRLVDMVRIARETHRVIRQNLVWALVYNLVCIPLALIGRITPIWAAGAMLISSLTVVMNSRRLTWKLDRQAEVRRG